MKQDNARKDSPMAKPIEVTDSTFQEKVLGNDKPVVVDFWATWCPPCKILHPIVDQVADEYEGRIVICKVDVDQNQALAQQYGIRSIPTLLFFKGGQVTDQVVGALPKNQLTARIDALL